MTKTELIETMAENTGLSKAEAKKALDCALEEIQKSVARGEKVQFPGFGTFEARQRAGRTGKNPRTGEAITIPACAIPAFKAGKGFKDLVNR